tara:strand:+ start:5854 stop:6015 length:162 start_codon:yes stop_codon:yes gene_type:complete
MLLLITSMARISSVSSSIPMYLAPEAAFDTAMLARVPFSLAFGLDAGAIHKQV